VTPLHPVDPAPAATPPRLSVTLDGDPVAVVRARDDVRALAERAGFGERAGDVALAVAELLANAVEHGAPPVTVDAWFDGRLIIEVTDRGRGLDREAVWRRHPPPARGDRGRGLWIVRQLMDVVNVTRDGGTRVHVELCPEPHIGA